MKSAILICLLLSGCANKCPDCLSLTRAQLGAAMQKAWINGYGKGFDDGEDAADIRKVKPL